MTIDPSRIGTIDVRRLDATQFLRDGDYGSRNYWYAMLRTERLLLVEQSECHPDVVAESNANGTWTTRRIWSSSGVVMEEIAVHREPGVWYLPQVNRNPQEEVDWACFQLRDRLGAPYSRIALLIGYQGESGARMAVNRYRSRNLGVTRGYSYELGRNRMRRTGPVSIETRTFGVEVEFKELDFYRAAEIVESVTGRHCHTTDYHGRSCHTCRQRVGYQEWKVEKDASVCRTNSDGDMTGGEAIAPVGCGQEHLDEIGAVMTALRAAGAVVDADAGMHVHMSMRDLGNVELAQFVLLFQEQQEFLWGLVAPSRRNNSYCQALTLTEANRIARQFQERGEAYGPRGALNIAPFPRLGTFEIRMHQGSLNARKMKSWVRLLLAYTQAVKEDKHRSYQANLSVLGSLTADGFLDQQVGAYLYARHTHFAS